jgi:hypothetical protein
VVAVSLIIFYSSTTLLSVMITESTGTVHAYETELQLGSGFRDDFQGSCDYVFGDDYRVTRDCAHRQIQASAGEEVLVMIL